MINAEAFIEAARGLGFTHYTGVPCSYLTPFINYVINDDQLSYISSANEGDAVATAAGLTLGGQSAAVMMQNSGLGNAVNPLTSLAHTFAVPLLLIVTHRGKPGRRDEPQHELMGKITGDLFDLMEIPREPFPADERDIGPALERANRYLTERQRPYALLMEQGTVAPHPLEGESIPSRAGIQCLRKSIAEAPAQLNRGQALWESGAAAPERLTREQALREIIDHTPVHGSILVGTTGYTGRELFAIDDRDNQLYMVGSMGCASSFALGLSLARPDLEVTVVDGDGAGLMRMGNFATIGSYGRNNLVHVLLDNGVHESTGSQAHRLGQRGLRGYRRSLRLRHGAGRYRPRRNQGTVCPEGRGRRPLRAPENNAGCPIRTAPPGHITRRRPAPPDGAYQRVNSEIQGSE